MERRRTVFGAVCGSLLLAAACSGPLPDQDRRIVAAAPDAKLSADLLVKDFAADSRAASRRYHGRTMLVTGVVTATSSETGHAFVRFGAKGEPGIEARLLDDEAAQVLAVATPGERVTLKCFCEGLDRDVILKSCVKPGS